jgi:hypothetical protein
MSAARVIVPPDVAKASARMDALANFAEYWTIFVSSMRVSSGLSLAGFAVLGRLDSGVDRRSSH